MKDIADMAIACLQEGITIEEQIVTKEHELHEKLFAIDNIFGFLDDHIPLSFEYMHELNNTIFEGILSIRACIDEYKLQEISFIKEEKEVLQQLKGDVEHKDWQAVKKIEDKVVRVEKEHLEHLHKEFIVVMKEMKKSTIIKTLLKDKVQKKDVKEYVNLEEHYFAEIYKFLRAYERVLRHLIRKENKIKRF